MRMAAARDEAWLQQFVWFDGVCKDTRCESHLVDLFQRVSSFAMTVATRLVARFDASHAYDSARRSWQG